jgi:hypothetical protein
MSYMTVWERRGHEKGLEQGVHLGKLHEARLSILEILQERFLDVPAEWTGSLERIDNGELLRALRRRAVSAESLAEFEAELQAAQ